MAAEALSLAAIGRHLLACLWRISGFVPPSHRRIIQPGQPTDAGAMAARKAASTVPRVAGIVQAIAVLRGRRVMLDADLAALYGVSTRRLNEQVRRNRSRFPDDFLLELTVDEYANLKSHFATSSWGGRRRLPLAFTEHGAIQVAAVLNSPRAVEMSVYVVRAFVKLRQLFASKKDLARKLGALERSLLAMDLRTQRQFKEVYAAIRALMKEPAPKRRGIGFMADLDGAA